MPTLHENDIVLIRDEVAKELKPRLEQNTPGKGQALGFEILPELVSKVVLPIVVSLSSRGLYDVLQGKVLGSLKKKQTDKLTAGMVGAEIRQSGEIDETCMNELKRELLPLGITEEQIQGIYSKIKLKLNTDANSAHVPSS
jgi:hypothetical protein